MTKNQTTGEKLIQLVKNRLDELRDNPSTNRMSFSRYLEEELDSLLNQSMESD